jgi:Zn finger protein HypA/HybF involved in hydrogenase expression
MTTDSATQEVAKLQKIFEKRKADLRCPVCGTDTQMVMSGGSINAGLVYDSIT